MQNLRPNLVANVGRNRVSSVNLHRKFKNFGADLQADFEADLWADLWADLRAGSASDPRSEKEVDPKRFPTVAPIGRKKSASTFLLSRKKEFLAQAQANSAMRRRGPRLPTCSAGWENAVTYQ